MPRILPQYDAELTRPVGERLRELGVDGADRRQSEGAYADEGRACRRTIRRFDA